MLGALSQIPLIALVFVIAGGVKGVVGMGLPTVAVGLLGLMMPPVEAAALLIVPSFLTNLWQFLAGSNRRRLLRRIGPMLFALAGTTWAAAGMIAGANAARAATLLGLVLVAYGAIGLAKVPIVAARRHEAWLAPLVGAATGIVTGATGVFVMPAAPYLQALNLDKDALVQALGLSFTVSTVALAAGLASEGAFLPRAAVASALCTLPALFGMAAGQAVRTRIDATTFRRLFFTALLLLGGSLVARSIA